MAEDPTAERRDPPIADPEIRKKPRISAFWIVPLLTLLIAAWLAYDRFAERGPLIIITFQFAEGLEVGKTKVKYRGIDVGAIEALTLTEDLSQVVVEARMVKAVKAYLAEGARFWVVRPEVSLRGVSGLSTLVSGDYIAFEPGSGAAQRHFEGLAEEPDMVTDTDGLPIVLRTAAVGSVSPGAPLLFRGVRVGEVAKAELADDDEVRVKVIVDPQHAGLVHENSRFWVASGIQVSVGDLLGTSIKLPSLESLLVGGIAFDNPASAGRPAKAGAEFALFDEAPPEFAERPQVAGLKLRFYVRDVNGLSIGAPITYQGLTVGEVVAVTGPDDAGRLTLQAVVEAPYGRLVESRSVFWVEDGLDLSIGSLLTSRQTPVSLRGLLGGSIAFANPPGAGGPVASGTLFELQRERPAFLDRENGLSLTLTAHALHGLAPGDPVLFRGFTVGEVLRVEVREASDAFRVSLVVLERYAKLVRANSVFWNASGLRFQAGELLDASLDIESLASLIAGGIAFDTVGALGPQAEDGDSYRLLPRRPQEVSREEGETGRLRIVLEAASLGSVAIDDPLYYREFPVGKVVAIGLNDDASRVRISVAIDGPYTSLIKSNTVFWNASGLKASFGLLSGVKVDLESLGALIRGGIALATPPSGGTAAKAGAVYPLHPRAKTEWTAWAPHIRLPQETAGEFGGDPAPQAATGNMGPTSTEMATPTPAAETERAPTPIPDAIAIGAGAHASPSAVASGLADLGFENLGQVKKAGAIFTLDASWQGQPLRLEVDAANGRIAATPR